MSRFVLSKTGGCGSKLYSRNDVNPRLTFEEGMDAGAFMARLWTLFGPATAIDDGFEYVVVDRESKLTFSAYSGASGPSYGGARSDEPRLLVVLSAFENLLSDTKASDCELEVNVDFDYGSGTAVIGYRDGQSFWRKVEREFRDELTKVMTYESCIAAVKERADSYGMTAGFQVCLRSLMPDPEEIVVRGQSYESYGFELGDEDQPGYFALLDEDAAPEFVNLAEVEGLVITSAARRWLKFYDRFLTHAS